MLWWWRRGEGEGEGDGSSRDIKELLWARTRVDDGSIVEAHHEFLSISLKKERVE